MVTIGYVGEYLDVAEVPAEEEVEVRRTRGRSMEAGRLKKIIQAVAMAVMVALGEAHTSEEAQEEDQGLSFAMLAMCMVVIVCVVLKLKTPCAAAVCLKRRGEEKNKRKGGRKEEGRRRRKKKEKEWLRSLQQALPSNLSKKGRRKKRRSPR